MNLLVAATTGWGKSYAAQALTGANIPVYPSTVVLDFKSEYWGLCHPDHGPAPATYWEAGPRERDLFSREHWIRLLDQGAVVLDRHDDLDVADWREVCASVVEAARHRGGVLIVLDEAHFLAPQREGYPGAIKGLATTGRGEGVSAMWVTQRLAEIDETILSMATARYLGGFTSDADLGKIGRVVDYPADVHRAGGSPVPDLPTTLHADDGPVPVRKRTDDDGSVTGSEWIYSDETGEMDRRDSADLNPACAHVGASGRGIKTTT